MIMAAGLGTRMQPFTKVWPKPLLPVLGVPLIQFWIDRLVEAQIFEIAVNIHHLPEQTKKGLGQLRIDPRVKITICDETGELLGSGGGLRNAAKALGLGDEDYVLYLNGDVLFDVDLSRVKREAVQGGPQAFLILKKNETQTPYREILFDPSSGVIQSLGELRLGAWFWTGVGMFRGDVIKRIPEGTAVDLVSSLLRPLVKERLAFGCDITGEWFDVGEPSHWYELHFVLLGAFVSGALPKLWNERISRAIQRQGLDEFVGTSEASIPFLIKHSTREVAYDYKSFGLKHAAGIQLLNEFWESATK